jgi:hypothetical protein
MRTRHACNANHVEIRNPRNFVSTLSKYELIMQSIPFILKLSKTPWVALPMAWQHPGAVLTRAKVRMAKRIAILNGKGDRRLAWLQVRQPPLKIGGMVKDGHVPAETCAGKSLASIRTMSRPWQKH